MKVIILIILQLCFLPVIAATSSWRDVQEHVKNAVVQIIVDRAVFNWLEPYKTPKIVTTYGSGFFFNGKIVTNFHVIKEAINTRIQIPALGRQQLTVRVAGVCPTRDLGILELTDESREELLDVLDELPSLELGDSDAVYRTQEVLAFGYPLGQQKLKATQGIISGRELLGENKFYLQTSAGLNPGNSGGPLLGIDGCVIGINTAITKKAQNIGHILPTSDITHYLDALNRHNFVQPPTLGAEFCFANKHLLEHLGAGRTGCYIARVFPGTLSDRLGLREGDVLITLNNHKIDNYGEVDVDWSEERIPCSVLVDRIPEGGTVQVEFLRQGKRCKKTSKLEYKDARFIRYYYPPFEKVAYELIGGLVIMPLTLNHLDLFAQHMRSAYKKLSHFEQPENQYEPHLVVTHILPGSLAQQARVITAGDLITHVNGSAVATIDQLRSALTACMENDSDDYIIIKTSTNKLLVMPKDDLVKQEGDLARDFRYKPSKPLLQALALIQA